MIANLVLLRHGESLWNAENKFCGWADISLSQKGIEEAEFAAKCLNEENMKFDIVYTSYLDRSINTADVVLANTNHTHIPRFSSWRLNERHYGALQKLNKAETAAKYGDEQVKIWRRSYDIPPPQIDENSEFYPGKDPKYNEIPKDEIPLGESLKMTIERVRPYWESEILPKLNEGKSVLVVAHGNSLRSIVKILEDISEAELLDLNIPTAAPLYYKLDNLKILEKRYIMPENLVKEKIQAVANQGKAKQ